MSQTPHHGPDLGNYDRSQNRPPTQGSLTLSSSRLNTFAILASFCGSIFLGGIAYNKLQTGIDASTGFQVDTKERLARLDTDRSNARQEIDKRIGQILDTISKQSAVMDQMTYQIGQLQKADESNNARVDRMADTYNGRFSELNEKFNGMVTQQALTNQTLLEIKQQIAGWQERTMMHSGDADNFNEMPGRPGVRRQ
jgi:flagellar capping protein FliD